MLQLQQQWEKEMQHTAIMVTWGVNKKQGVEATMPPIGSAEQQ